MRISRAGDEEAVAALEDTQRARVTQQALQNIGRTGIWGLGLGATAGGIVGLINLARRNLTPYKPSTDLPILPVPYPARRKQERKVAVETLPRGLKWYYPALTATGIGTTMLGYKAVKDLMDHQRRKQTQQELEQARQEFHDTLLSQYDPEPKLASASSELNYQLDRLFDRFEVFTKSADDPWYERFANWVGGGPNAAGAATGILGTYALLSTALAGSVAYDQARKRSREAIINKAIARRNRQRFLASPPELYAKAEPFETPLTAEI